MNKTLTGIALGASLLVGGTTIDMVPRQSPMDYSYQYPVGTYVPSYDIVTATGTISIINDQPDYADTNGDGYISVKVSHDWKGNKVYEQTDKTTYQKYSSKGGSAYITPVNYSITAADALLEAMATPAQAAVASTSSFYLNFSGTSGSTASQTISGSNTLLVCYLQNNTGANNFTSATMNGVSMVNSGVNVQEGTTGRYTNMWYLYGATTGVLTVNRSTSNDTWVVCESFSGVKQAAPEASTTGSFAGGSGVKTTTLTTLTDNAWTQLNQIGSRTVTAGTGSTFIVNNTAGYSIFDSNGPVTPAGSHSMSFTQSPDDIAQGTIMLSIAPAVTIINTTNNGCHGEFHGTMYCQQ